VEFYRNLPTHGYNLLILRVHSTEYALFTSEPYSKGKYVEEQLTNRLILVAYSKEEAEKGIVYFGILPKFVLHMKGKFQNTTIIMTGCSGLTYTIMAEAFIKKGAKAYIGWSGGVLASHSDQATILLLKHLLKEKQTVNKAVKETMNEVGPDPIDKSILLCYPE
jgi:hypothetical protein